MIDRRRGTQRQRERRGVQASPEGGAPEQRLDGADAPQPFGLEPQRTYMPTLPLKEAREMLEKWGEELEKILGGAVASAQGQAE